MPTNANLGAAIRRLRHERGLTIESLAFASDIHPTYLSEIEQGNRNPTWQIVCRLVTRDEGQNHEEFRPINGTMADFGRSDGSDGRD
jgi:transcriptional regulator with XRE-family HTH domain